MDNEGQLPPDIKEVEFVRGPLIVGGRFCEVFQGTYRDQPVVIKVPNTDSVESILGEYEAKLKQEGKLIWSLRHDHVVKLHGVCISSSSLILEWCAGGPLSALLGDIAQAPLRTLMTWCLRVARGMEYVHSERLIHRDLRSGNILLVSPYQPDNDGAVIRVKISNFCFSRRTDQEQVIIEGPGGHPSSRAPESIKYHIYSKKSDVWGFGILVWELLTKQMPYQNINSDIILDGIRRGKLQLPIPGTCPEKFRHLIIPCWNTNAQARPSFESVIAHLSEILNASDLDALNSSFHKVQDQWPDEIRNAINQQVTKY